MAEASLVEDSRMRRGLFLVLVVACGRETGSKPAVPVETGSLGAAAPTTIETADTATVLVPLTLPSQLYVEHDATVYARSAGVVESILVDLGSPVTRGQPLARLESSDQRIVLDQARERLANATRSVERQRALKTAGVVTQADSERMELEHHEAQLDLRKAQRDFDLTRIAAPFSGVVTARSARIGRLVSSGDSLFRVTALRPMLAIIHVPESSSAGLAVGSGAEIVGGGGETARARVIRASPVLDAASGTRELILQVTSSTGLSPGASVTVRLGSERRQVVTIPRVAVGQDGYALVWADDRTTLRALTLGTELDGGRVEVLKGLSPGEKVVRAAP
jgi:membrane fusion protein, multidrug efflux system